MLSACKLCKMRGKIGTSTSPLLPNANGEILWHLNNFTPDQDRFKTIRAFEEAFKFWQERFHILASSIRPGALSPLKFKSISTPNQAAINVFFMANGNPNLPERFDPSTLAYAFFPRGTSLGLESDMFFNETLNWQEMASSSAVELFAVAVHEIGHALGLEHSDMIGDIMEAIYAPGRTVLITDDTLNGLSRLYSGIIRELLESQEDNVLVDTEEEFFPEEECVPDWSELLSRLYTRIYQVYRLHPAQLDVVVEYLGLELPERARRFEKIREVIKKLELRR